MRDFDERPKTIDTPANAARLVALLVVVLAAAPGAISLSQGETTRASASPRTATPARASARESLRTALENRSADERDRVDEGSSSPGLPAPALALFAIDDVSARPRTDAPKGHTRPSSPKPQRGPPLS